MTRPIEAKKRPESDWKSDLDSEDEARVISALHEACPCSGSAELYEKYMSVLNKFKKDARPAVRKIALHLEVDAIDQLREDEERGSGFVRNRPGGNGRRKEPRRPHVRKRNGEFRSR